VDNTGATTLKSTIFFKMSYKYCTVVALPLHSKYVDDKITLEPKTNCESGENPSPPRESGENSSSPRDSGDDYPSTSKKSRQETVKELLDEIHEISKELSKAPEEELENLTDLFLSLYKLGSLILKRSEEIKKYPKLKDDIMKELVKHSELLQNFLRDFHLIYGVRFISPPSLRCQVRSGICFLLQHFTDKKLKKIFKKELLDRVDRIFESGILKNGDELSNNPVNLLPDHKWWNTTIYQFM
jgi:hypothetical protein